MIRKGCRRKGTEILADDEGYDMLVEEEWPLSNDAAGGAASAIGVDGGGRLRCRLGLWVGGEEGEEGIH